MKLFTFLLGAIITLQPAYGQKGPRLVAEEDESEGMAMDEVWKITVQNLPGQYWSNFK